MNTPELRATRRGLFTLSTGAAAAAALSGCGGTSSTSSAGASVNPATVLPRHISRALVKPTKPAQGDWVEALYLDYPTHLARSVESTPGRGSTFNVMTPYWGQPIAKNTPYTKNLTTALGATLNQIAISSGDYTTKLTATLAAGQDLPDVMSCMVWDYPPRLNDALHNAFANLSEVLGGHGIDEYPNLANLPTSAWKGGLWQNQLYSYPGHMQHTFGLVPFYRSDIWAKAGITSVKGADQLLAMAKELTHPASKTYALTGNLQALVLRLMYGMYFDDMDTDSSGRVQMYWERDDYPEALELMCKLAPYAQPDLLVGTGDATVLFAAGKIALSVDGAEAYLASNDSSLPAGRSPGYHSSPWVPTNATGGPAVYKVGPPVMLNNFISRNVTGDRLKELLRVLDYLAAPFGTKEWELVNYGTEGSEFTRVNGAPSSRSATVGDAFIYTAASPMAIYGWNNAGNRATAEDFYAWQQTVAPRASFIRTMLVHPALPSHLQRWKEDLGNLENSIVQGQAPLSSFAPALKSWKAKYGDAVREVYQQALANSPIRS